MTTTTDLIREAPAILHGDPDTLDERLDAWIAKAHEKLAALYYVRQAARAERGYYEHQIGMLQALTARSKRTEDRMEAMAADIMRARREAVGLGDDMPIDVRLDIGIRPALRLNPPAVKILDEQAIPRTFFRQPPTPPPTPDKGAILAALKAGEKVPGVEVGRGQRFDWGEPRAAGRPSPHLTGDTI